MARIASLLSKPLAKDVAWAALAQGGRVALQGVSFVLLARALGAQGLGIFSGTAALISVFVPFCGWGSANLILKYVSRDRHVYPVYLGSAIIIGAGSALILTCLALFLGPICLGTTFDRGTFFLLVASELFMLRVVDVAAQAFPAVDRQDLVARTYLFLGACRLASVLLFMAVPFRRSVMLFAACYLLGTIVAAVDSFRMLVSQFGDLGRPRFSSQLILKSLREGFPFSLGTASKSVYADIDKTMLTRMASPEVNGIYTAAYRIIGMAFIPLQALVLSIAPRLFRKGAGGATSVSGYARRLLPPVIVFGCFAGCVLWLSAPLLPLAIGRGFGDSAAVLRYLAWMPLIQGIHYLLGDALMGMNRQGIRSVCQVGAAVVNIILNLWLIPAWSWKGAVLATYGAEGMLAIAMAILVCFYAVQAAKAAGLSQRVVVPSPAGVLGT